MRIVETGRQIRTTYDMKPVTAWLEERIGPERTQWKWKVSKEWIPDWGHPMQVEFDDTVDEKIITLFALRWS